MTRISIAVSKEFHQALKIHTAYTSQNISNFVRKAIHDRILQENEPNEETQKVLLESRAGIGLNEYDSWDEMINKIQKEITEENDV